MMKTKTILDLLESETEDVVANKQEAKKSREQTKLDNEIDGLYNKHGFGVQINMMDIQNVFKDCRAAFAAGKDLEQAVKDAIEKYKVN